MHENDDDCFYWSLRVNNQQMAVPMNPVASSTRTDINANHNDTPIHIELTYDRIDIERCITQLSHPEAGGHSLFVGTTKRHFHGKRVALLEYEAYYDMAIKSMKKIAHDMMNKWPLLQVIFIHRLGTVNVQEASIVVGTSSVHREECIRATEYGINQVKRSVPIWKREYYCTCNSVECKQCGEYEHHDISQCHCQFNAAETNESEMPLNVWKVNADFDPAALVSKGTKDNI